MSEWSDQKTAEFRRRLGARLRNIRRTGGMTQQQLAEASDTAQSTVSRIEHGTIDVGLNQLHRMADALGTTPAELFKGLRDEVAEAVERARSLVQVVPPRQRRSRWRRH